MAHGSRRGIRCDCSRLRNGARSPAGRCHVASEYPSRDEVIRYLTDYEHRYQIPIRRPVHVTSVTQADTGLLVETNDGHWLAQTVISATGTWKKPYIPTYPGQELFEGEQLHSANYRNAGNLHGKNVLVVGGGNWGSNTAEVSLVCNATWVTVDEPLFLPDEVDGRVLFERATEKWKAQSEGRPAPALTGGLGDVVMVKSVKEARSRGVLHSVRPFSRFVFDGVVWADGSHSPVDTVIWCTGFRPALDHLDELGVLESDGRVATEGTHAIREPRLWLVGYGEWTGFASATLIGVMRGAGTRPIRLLNTLLQFKNGVAHEGHDLSQPGLRDVAQHAGHDSERWHRAGSH